jgi:hypothetical protein
VKAVTNKKLLNKTDFTERRFGVDSKPFSYAAYGSVESWRGICESFRNIFMALRNLPYKFREGSKKWVTTGYICILHNLLFADNAIVGRYALSVSYIADESNMNE